MNNRVIIQTLSFVSLFCALPSFANDDYGPLLSYSQSPMHSARHTPTLRSGFPMYEQEIELFASFTAASIWANSDDYHLDYYQNQLHTGLRWQIHEDWQLELNYRWLYAGNNHLDSLIIDFHDFFSIDQAGRDQKDKHEFDIYAPQHGVNISDFSGDTLTSAFTLYSQYQFINTQSHGLSLGVALYKNNVNNGIFKGESFEQSAQVNYSYAFTQQSIYTSFAISHQSDYERENDFPHKSTLLSFMAGYRLELITNHELHLEYRWYEGAENGNTEFSEAANEILFGYRYKSPLGAIELSIIENIVNMDNSTDVGFQIAYRYRIKNSE
ncbi:DUF3187 family protein [Vibrio sp. D404a]|uniref:DUF3187 family protein n=1 Tax=unclassified Vibrio TaxID=2614977 RepID=UPI0025541354|nr:MULTISPECIES: DUF3187 family protein [unclassified Vibrio]MDK9740068.1 DUF3187 family protein [Vibrio sp. D404a]MDK9799365.1 DUF3187 family protein [Vibrio sp. D449a]